MTSHAELADRAGAIRNQLRGERLRLEAERDRRAVFAFAYEALCDALLAAVSESPFERPNWIAELDEAFADRYLAALAGEDDGPWATVFRRSDEAGASVLEDMLLGMTAHIVWDLPHALLRTIPGQLGVSPDEVLPDFHAMNAILARSIDGIQHRVSQRYNPLLGALDRWAGRRDERITDHALRMARAVAWYNYARLRTGTLALPTRASLDKAVTAVTEGILAPDAAVPRMTVHATRGLLRPFRRWVPAT